MNGIKLRGSRYSGNTIVSNCFIDNYMAEANEAQLKIYLYLMRCIEADEPVSVLSIADRFNYTERDVLRSLVYWSKNGIVTLEYDNAHNVTGITLNDPQDAPENASFAAEPLQLASAPSYSQEKLRAFRNRADVRQLVFVTEQYFKQTLSLTDLTSLLYLYDELHFSTDLIEFLIEYSVNSGKPNMRYIEEVALNWSDEGIHTPEEAKNYIRFHNKDNHRILKEFGISDRSLTPVEADYIDKWKNEYHFSIELICEAAARTIRQIAKPSFPYADSILSAWNKAGVKKPEDINVLDTIRGEKRAPAFTAVPGNASRPVVNRFKNFTERDYDMTLLEKELSSKALAKASDL